MTFGQSGLEKLGLGGRTDSKGSSGQDGSTGGGLATVSDGSGSGSSSNIKVAAPSGSSASPLTGFEALMQQFGMNDFGAHLKDGSFDLDNFSVNLNPDQDFVLDLDGNGKQDIIEWTIDMVVASNEEQQEIADIFQDNINYAEMKAIAFAHLAEYHII